jgi:chaperone required for assembly of F1-ATPase
LSTATKLYAESYAVSLDGREVKESFPSKVEVIVEVTG